MTARRVPVTPSGHPVASRAMIGECSASSNVPTLIDRAEAPNPRVHAAGVTTVYHFSEDGTLKRFAPHVPPTNPSHPPAVWAIDDAHAPLYWFPRDCPRVSVWANDPEQQAVLRDRFGTEATRICAAETGWFDRIRSTRLYRYEFDAAQFEPWELADGQYVASDAGVGRSGRGARRPAGAARRSRGRVADHARGWARWSTRCSHRGSRSASSASATPAADGAAVPAVRDRAAAGG